MGQIFIKWDCRNKECDYKINKLFSLGDNGKDFPFQWSCPKCNTLHVMPRKPREGDDK